MKRTLQGALVLGVVLACVAGGATAQDRPADLMEVAREKARADKKLLVATALELTEREASGFWPVYNAYQSDMISHYDRIRQLITDYAGAYETMTDEVAAKLLAQFLSLEADHAALLKSYAPRFERVLPARKVARLYQIENKLRALVNYDLARDIPLIK
jgi:hypothetical protein